MNENGSCLGGLIGVALGIGLLVLAIYVISLVAGAIAVAAGAGGVLWGGGTALVNYGKSFKENIIDSNRTPA